LFPTAEQLRQGLGASPLGFSVVFVDRGGSIRWTAAEPMNPTTISELFDWLGATAEVATASSRLPERAPKAVQRKTVRK